MRRLHFRLLGVVFTLAVWELISLILPANLAPGPLDTFLVLAGNAYSGILWPNLADTVRRSLLGFGIALTLGLLAGTVMGLRRVANELFDYTIFVVMAIPSLAWSVVGILWLGPNEYAGVFVTAVICLPAVVLTIREGVRDVDRSLVTMARSFHVDANRIFSGVVLPSISPYIFGAARYALSLAWKLTVITELIGIPTGVGRMLVRNYTNFQMGQVFAWTLAFTIVVLVTDNFILKQIERWVFRWRG